MGIQFQVGEQEFLLLFLKVSQFDKFAKEMIWFQFLDL